MNELANKFLLAGDKFQPEMHLKQPRFTYSAGGLFLKKTKKEFKDLKKQKIIKYIYRKEPDKSCFNMIWLMGILKIQ